MLGHLLPAAAAASLIKTSLALYHRTTPPTLHAEAPQAHHALEETRFYLANEPRPWIHGGAAGPRRAGVNAFGFGGINGHAILEEYPHDENGLKTLERKWPVELVLVVADSRTALIERAKSLAAWLRRYPHVSLLDVAATCAADELEHSARLLADPQRDSIQDRTGVFWYASPLARQGRVAAVFPGEGSQYPNMLADICRHFPDVRKQFDLTSRAFELQGRSFGSNVFPQPNQTSAAEVELFGMETAIASVTAAGRGLWKLLQRLGIGPRVGGLRPGFASNVGLGGRHGRCVLGRGAGGTRRSRADRDGQLPASKNLGWLRRGDQRHAA
jgi:acyl transferase domain-containing protein